LTSLAKTVVASVATITKVETLRVVILIIYIIFSPILREQFNRLPY